MVNQIRERVSSSLLLFGTDRYLLTRELELRLLNEERDRPGTTGALAAVAAARAWESTILWLAWRLQPRTSARL